MASADYRLEADHPRDEVILQERLKARKLFFNALPHAQTAKLNIVPNVGSEVVLIHNDDATSLGVATTCYALFDEVNHPIEQGFEIYIDRDFFNDIYAQREAKLHLHVRCGIATVDDADFKQHPIISFRVSRLPHSDEATKLNRPGLAARLFK